MSNNEEMVRLVSGDEAVIMTKKKALNMAFESRMDLVLIDDRANPPVVKIMDEGKYNYELQKKKKRSDKQQKSKQIKTKEIQLRPVTGDNDIKIKSKNINEFLEKGYTVKISIKFRGRESSHIEMAENVIEKTLSLLNNYSISHDTRGTGKDIIIIIENSKE